MIVVGSGLQMFLVKTVFLIGLACRIPVSLRKEETNQNRYTQMLDFIEERGTGKKQSCEDIVTAVVSWPLLTLRVSV